MQETQVRPLGQEDPLEEDMATHTSVLAWRIPWTEEPGGLQVLELQHAVDCSMEKEMVTHYSCLGNSMDREDWRATVCGVTKSQT